LSRNIISVEDLNKSFSEIIICSNETFGIDDNEKIGLVGVNGCGKTTLLKMLIGTESPDNGNITFRNDIKIGYLS